MTYYGKVCFTLRIDVMGVGFDNLTKSEFTAKAEDMLEKKERGYVVTPNAEIVYESIHDDGFRALLNDASMVLPDGAGVVLGAKILGTPIKEKVAGIEFGEEVCKLLAKNGGRLYLLGSKPGVAELAGEKLAAKYPGLVICGTGDGYFQDEKAVEFAAGTWATYMMTLAGKFPKLNNPLAWIKTIEGMYLEISGADVDWQRLANDAGVTPRTLSTRKKKLMQAGNELMLKLTNQEKDGKTE